MMKAFRKAAVAVMFGVLIVAFALWGVGDYMNRQSQKSLAKIGSVEITPQQFQQAYQRTLENLSSRARRRISTQEARALGVPERVLQSLIQDTAVDVEADNLGLGLSKEGLRDAIYGNDFFQDGSGKFSPQKYQDFLAQINYTAPAFEEEYKKDLVRRQIRGVFDKAGIVPGVLLSAYDRYLNEERTLSYFTLNAEAAGTIEPPSAEILRAYYDDRKALFMAPELRKISAVAISPELVASKIHPTDEELKATYDAKAANYGVPERRKIEIIPFQTLKAADNAAAALKSGKDFLDVGKEAGFKQPELDVGTVSKKEFGDKFNANGKMIDAAFALEKGQVSDPIEGPLSTVIIRVLEIVPGHEKSFDEVKDQIRQELVKARTIEETEKLTKAFEEARTAGIPLADIAKKLDLALTETVLDSGGKDADGKPVIIPGVPSPALASAAFKSDIGVENEALRLPGNGYAWFEVLDITKARQKTFEEVKADAEAGWHKEQIRTKLAEKARDLVTRLDKGEAIADVAKSAGAEVKTTKALKRNDTDPSLPASAVGQAFSLGQGGASSASAGDGTLRVVFQVLTVTPPKPLDEAGTKALEEKLARSTADDNFAEYLAGVTTRAGTSIDSGAVAAIAGGSADFGE